MIKCILALNGILPKKEFFSTYSALPLIATDGAGSALLKMGIKPTLIIGDLDSLEKNQLDNIKIISAPDQNYTDFEKALLLLEQRGLLPCFIVGVTGKELDHTLYNLHVISRLSKKHNTLFGVTETNGSEKMGTFCHDKFCISLPKETLISLIPFPIAALTTEGLHWDLHNEELHQEKRASIRNRVQETQVKITVHSGTLLILFDCVLSKLQVDI